MGTQNKPNNASFASDGGGGGGGGCSHFCSHYDRRGAHSRKRVVMEDVCVSMRIASLRYETEVSAEPKSPCIRAMA